MVLKGLTISKENCGIMKDVLLTENTLKLIMLLSPLRETRP